MINTSTPQLDVSSNAKMGGTRTVDTINGACSNIGIFSNTIGVVGGILAFVMLGCWLVYRYITNNADVKPQENSMTIKKMFLALHFQPIIVKSYLAQEIEQSNYGTHLDNANIQLL